MQIVLAALIVIGLIPLGVALWANRGTSLTHALGWAVIGWLSWGGAFLLDGGEKPELEPGRYCALCLTGCAGIAVLGARRPHVFAWNFVVLGLFAVMMLPLLEAHFIGMHSGGWLRVLFMAGAIAVGILNYLPTRLAPAAFLVMCVAGGEITLIYVPGLGTPQYLDLLLTTVPWLAWICLRQARVGRSDFDRLWLSFRDRWGLVWSQRVREQFNNAAENAGWPVTLSWRGLTPTTSASVDQEKLVEMLRAVLQRFRAPD